MANMAIADTEDELQFTEIPLLERNTGIAVK